MYVCICLHIYIHMYVYMYVCIYAYMYICKYVYMYIFIYVYMYTCIYVYMYICIYIYMYIWLAPWLPDLLVLPFGWFPVVTFVHSFAPCLGSVQAHVVCFLQANPRVSCGSHALTAALETWSAFASVIVCGIASFELLCAWRFRFQARASCATKTSWFSSGLGVEGTSCSRSHNPGGNRTAMLRQGPLFNLSDVSLRIGHTSLSWTTVHEISRAGTTRPSPQLPLAWHAWPRLFRFWPRS